MRPAPFSYRRPATVDDAVGLLGDLVPLDGRVRAGRQSLVPIMAFRLARTAHLIDINPINDLGEVIQRRGALHIRANVRHAFHRPVFAGPLGDLLTSALCHIAQHLIRIRGTFWGSLAGADPAAEWCLVAATLDAELVAVSTRGQRAPASRDFHRGAMETALASDEVLLEARLSLLPNDISFGFTEFNRRAGDYELAMALAAMRSRAASSARRAWGLARWRPGRAGLPPPRHCWRARHQARRYFAKPAPSPRQKSSRSRTHRPMPATAASWRRQWCFAHLPGPASVPGAAV